MQWKYTSEVEDDSYPVLAELIDQSTIRTQSQVQNTLSIDLKNKK